MAKNKKSEKKQVTSIIPNETTKGKPKAAEGETNQTEENKSEAEKGNLKAAESELNQAEEGDAKPVTGDGDAKPVTEEGDAKPVTEEGDAKPVTEEGDAKPVAEEGDAKPVTEEGDAKPVTEEGDAKPVTEEGDAKPVAEEGDAKPVTEEGDAKPVAEEGDAKPVTEEGDAKPVTEEGDAKPAAEEGDAKPAAEEGDAKPVTEEGDAKPVTEEGDAKPAAEEGDAKPVTEEDKNNHEIKTIIKWCFKGAAGCILWLTFLLSFILIANQCSQKNASYPITDYPKYYNMDSIDHVAENVIHFNVDSTGKSVINVDEQKVLNTEVNLPEPSGFLDSIVYNLTLAVNSVNNVLTSGSILIAILTLFIALVGVFAYLDLKRDVTRSMDETRKEIKDFKIEVNNNIAEDKGEREKYKQHVDNSYDVAQQKIQFLESSQIKQTRFFKKTKEYLYSISNCILDLSGNDQDLYNELYHELHIMTLYHYEPDENSKEYADLVQDKMEAIENLKTSGTLEDIPDLETIAKIERDEEIKKSIQGLIGIINYKNGQS